jgi:periplasmic protein CpxP/Spy
MISFRDKFAAWSAVAVLGAASLFAAETSGQGSHRHGGRGTFFGTQLGLTDAQKAQVKSIFDDARQSGQPVRDQLKQTRQSLRTAVQANNTAQIQQLSTVEGGQIGQLAAIRGAAMAKVYQILTPDQQQKLVALEQAGHARHQHRTGAAQTPAVQQN